MANGEPKPLPYRPCAGVALMNRAGKVFIGRRKPSRGAARSGYEWQMPQGGLDPGESPLDGARRELREETNVSSVSLVAEAPDWFTYDFPEGMGGRWSRRYRGQKQRWFLFRFEGAETEIDIHRPGGGLHTPEFEEWRWEELAALPALVVPFKRGVYQQVVGAFAPIVARERAGPRTSAAVSA